ncbi:MAG: hypothetical protein PHE67_00885 [Campylobacterales bacterium]|nr:hypothetical protein [Campylobacterales bacterium]
MAQKLFNSKRYSVVNTKIIVEKPAEDKSFWILGSDRLRNFSFWVFLFWIIALVSSDMYVFTMFFGFELGHYTEYILGNINTSSILYLFGISVIPFIILGFIFSIGVLPKKLTTVITFKKIKLKHMFDSKVYVLIVGLMLLSVFVGLVYAVPLIPNFEMAVFALIMFIFVINIIIFTAPSEKLEWLAIGVSFVLLVVLRAVHVIPPGHFFIFFFGWFLSSLSYVASHLYTEDVARSKNNTNMKGVYWVTALLFVFIVFFFLAASSNRDIWNSKPLKNVYSYGLFMNARLLTTDNDSVIIPINAENNISKIKNNIYREIRISKKDGKTLYIHKDTNISKLNISSGLDLYFTPLSEQNKTEVFVVKNRDLHNSCNKCYELLGYKVF